MDRERISDKMVHDICITLSRFSLHAIERAQREREKEEGGCDFQC